MGWLSTKLRNVDCKVNREFLPIKMVYFSYLGSFACMLPYMSVFFVHIGLSIWQVGILRCLEPLLSFICNPIWGATADKFGKHRTATVIALIGAGIFYFAYLFVPLMTGVSPDSLVQDFAVQCPSNNSYVAHISKCKTAEVHTARTNSRGQFAASVNESQSDHCSELCLHSAAQSHHHSGDEGNVMLCWNRGNDWLCSSCGTTIDNGRGNGRKTMITVFGLICSSHESHLKQYGLNATSEDGILATVSTADHYSSCQQQACCQCGRENIPNPRQGATFAICIVISVVAVAFNCNILMFLDAFAMGLLKGRQKDYGKNRMWGAVSWGVFAFLSGLAIDVYTDAVHAKTDRYEPAFIMFLIGIATCILIMLKMPLPEHQKPEAMKQNLRMLLCDGEILLFLFVVIVQGISFILSFTYVFIFMKELDSPYVLLGLAVGATAVAEIPFMFFSGTIIKRIGYTGVVYLTLIAYGIRYIAYSLIHNPWLIIPIQCLHGITYGLAWPMFTAFANAAAPSGMAATLQSIVACSFMGIGGGIGNLAGGLIYQEYGARLLFRCNGILCIVALGIFLFFTYCVLKKKRKVMEEVNKKEEEDHQLDSTEKGKKEMKDVTIDAVNWDDIECNGNEEEKMVTVTDSLNHSQNHNNTNATVHSLNI